MYKEFYRDSVLLHLPLFALLLFMAVFFGTLAWLFVFQRRSERFNQMAMLPLEPEAAQTNRANDKESQR